MNFPKRVVALDIETSGSIKTIKLTKLYLLGVAIFLRQKRSYKLKYYRYFTFDSNGTARDNKNRIVSFRQIKRMLTIPNSLIVGHNIYAFDLKVLNKYIPITKSMIDRSVDTLYILAKARASLCPNRTVCSNGLPLSRLLGGKAKYDETRKLKKHLQDWIRQGKIPKVVKCNKNDCMMAFELWQDCARTVDRDIPLPRYRDKKLNFDRTLCFFEQYPHRKKLRQQFIKGHRLSYEKWKSNKFLKRLPKKIKSYVGWFQPDVGSCKFVHADELISIKTLEG